MYINMLETCKLKFNLITNNNHALWRKVHFVVSLFEHQIQVRQLVGVLCEYKIIAYTPLGMRHLSGGKRAMSSVSGVHLTFKCVCVTLARCVTSRVSKN